MEPGLAISVKDPGTAVHMSNDRWPTCQNLRRKSPKAGVIMGEWCRMEKAYNTLGNRSWDAHEFDTAGGKDEDWLAHHRKYFICGGCEEPAAFVTKGRSKSPAHFRSKHADVGCDYASRGRSEGDAPEELEDVPAQFNEGSPNREIRYDKLRALNKPEAAAPSANGGAGTGQVGVAHVLPEDGPRARHSTTGLSRQLAHLPNDPDYPDPHVRLHIPERGQAVLATDYFCRFEDATADHAKPLPDDPDQRSPLMAYWGVVSRPIKSGKWLWLNPGEADQGLMTVRVEHLPFLTALGITDPGELREYHLIVEGRLEQGPRARYVTVTDFTKLALLPPRNFATARTGQRAD